MMRSAPWRWLVLVLHAVQLVGIPAWLGWQRAWLVLPLLAPLPGLWRGRPYTYAWASLLQVFYAGLLLVEAIGGSWMAVSLAGAAALEFCALLLFVRVHAAERRNAAG